MTRKIGSRYSVTAIIGRGTCGTVWEGTGPDGPVAVKLLREDLAADQTLIARFVQERTVLTSLVHPNVVAVRDLVVDGSDLALVMDLVRGSDLRVRLEAKGALPPAQAAALAADVAAGLAAAHARGVVHRDVKPENVLLDRESATARLTDFGIARLVDGPRRTRATRIVGTPDYLAPEVIEGCLPGPPVDVYALGTLIFELLTGWTPFGGGHPGAVLRRHVTEPVPDIPGMPHLLAELLTSCLSKAPAARLTAAEVAWPRVLAPHLAGLPALRVTDPRAALDPGALAAGAVPMMVGAMPLVRSPGGAADDARQTHTNLMRPIREPLGPSALIPATSATGTGTAMGTTTGAATSTIKGTGKHTAMNPAKSTAGDSTAADAASRAAASEAAPLKAADIASGGRAHAASKVRAPRDRSETGTTNATTNIANTTATSASTGASRIPGVAALTALGLVVAGGYAWLHGHRAEPAPSTGAVNAATATAAASSSAVSAPVPLSTRPVGPLGFTALADLAAPPSAPVGAAHYAVAGAKAVTVLTGADGVVRYAVASAGTTTGPGAHFSAWRPIPGLSTAATEPAVVGRSSGTVEVYVVSAADGQIHRAVFDGGAWSAWSTVPGVGSDRVVGTPAAVALGGGRTELLVSSAGGGLLASSGPPTAAGGSWLSWRTVSAAGTIKPDVALAAGPDGVLAAYVIRARDLAVLRVVNDGGWTYAWPTGAVGQPEAAYVANGMPYLFVQVVTKDIQIYVPSGPDLHGGVNWIPAGLTSQNPAGLTPVPGLGLVIAVTATDGTVQLYLSKQ